MKILYVVHYFLPRHQAGTEIYTALLARAMRAKGHEVTVFTSEDGRPASGRFELKSDDWEGMSVLRLMRGEPPDFARSYSDPEIDGIFRSVLNDERPDAVHFQHVFRLSAGMIGAAKESGARTIVTLADYWFICPPILLLRPGHDLCPGPEPDRCARCGNAIGALYSGAPGSALMGSENPRLAVIGGLAHSAYDRGVRAAHAVKRRLPRSWVEKARAWKQSRELDDAGSAFQQRRALLDERRTVMRETLSAADLVIAPSDYLRMKYLEAGVVAPEKIVTSDYGFDHAPFVGVNRASSDHPRLGFIGTPVEHKGVHVAVEAMNHLMDTNAELIVYGDLTWFPAYARRLKRLAKNPRVSFRGRFENRDAARILAGLDALIVPSLWCENSPLTIHEAFMAGVPVITSDLGGMAELVKNGGGTTFKTGGPADLAAVIRALISEPGKLESLRLSIPAVKSIEENAEELLHYYSGGSTGK
ncbi:MAG TPA: glycosyltransferase [bacterium]|nr:glycosyltransferase [bacterium]